jgi:hypothetical protein
MWKTYGFPVGKMIDTWRLFSTFLGYFYRRVTQTEGSNEEIGFWAEKSEEI